MSTNLDTAFEEGDLIEAGHVKQFAVPVNALESGAAFFRQDENTTPNAYQVAFDDPEANGVEDLSNGLMVHFKAGAANSGASQLTVVGVSGNLGPFAITKRGGDALEAGDIEAGQMVAVLCNVLDPDPMNFNARFEMIGVSSGSSEAPTGHEHSADDITSGQLALVRGGCGRDNSGNSVAIGASSLGSAVDIANVTALGWQSQASATECSGNTSVGYFSMSQNATGSQNVAIGAEAHTGPGGDENVFVGAYCAALNTGDRNTVLGAWSLRVNEQGSDNVAIGNRAMFSNTDGNGNVAIGTGAMFSNTTGSNNIAIGPASELPLVDGADQINIGGAFLRRAVTKSVGQRCQGVAYANSSDQVVYELAGSSGWLSFVDSTGSKCRAFVTSGSVTIENGSSDWVTSSSPGSGEIGLYVDSQQLHLVLGSAAARSIAFFESIAQF